jgi:DMSO/TMAO reductase YedYZ molybdopterin-dependent catalytic subunit
MGQRSLCVHPPAPVHALTRIMSDALHVIRHEPYNAETPEPHLVHAVTPAANTYVRTNFGVPQLTEEHVIEIGGAVAHPYAVTVAELRAMPQHTVTATMECAGNDRLDMRPLPTGEPWQSGALSTVTWTGVRLCDVLAKAGVADNALEVLVTAADVGPRDDAEGAVRFARSLPVADAVRADTLLALAMNGAPLSADHGAPVRLAVPGWYGMASVKWVTRIDVLQTAFTGYFQTQRYVYEEPTGVTPVDRLRVKSVITAPASGTTCASSVRVSGWAWSGFGAVTRVEVAVDGATPWHDAVLGAPASEHAWTPWHIDLTLPRRGRIVLRSRATDATGATQPDAIVWNRLGYGNNAIRQTVVDVVAD